MIVAPASLLDQFVHSLGVRDFASLESTFAPDIGFRALVPPGLREAHTRSEARGLYQRWFSDLQNFEMVGHTITPVFTRTHIAYRLHFSDEGDPKGLRAADLRHDGAEWDRALRSGLLRFHPARRVIDRRPASACRRTAASL